MGIGFAIPDAGLEASVETAIFHLMPDALVLLIIASSLESS